MCSKSFRNLGTHITSAHPVSKENLICIVDGCDQEFKTKNARTRHLQKEHGISACSEALWFRFSYGSGIWAKASQTDKNCWAATDAGVGSVFLMRMQSCLGGPVAEALLRLGSGDF